MTDTWPKVDPAGYRRLKPGEVCRAGDLLLYGKNGVARVRFCKYDPGCCVGHVVEEQEYYCRKEEPT